MGAGADAFGLMMILRSKEEDGPIALNLRSVESHYSYLWNNAEAETNFGRAKGRKRNANS